MANTVTRNYTFSNGGVADGGQVDSEIQAVVNAINNGDSGLNRWTVCDATTLKYGGQDMAQIAKYRRAVLQYNSATVVNAETGLNGTSGQLSVLFSDLSYRTDSTSGRIQCNLAQVAALTGTAQSGLQTGSASANTWYSIYYVKSQVNTTDLVVVAATTVPTQANYATLNTNFGTNGWVYAGVVPYGDGGSTTTSVPKFFMAGNMISFYNTSTGGDRASAGLLLANTAGATTLTWTYGAGTALGSAQVPAQVLIGTISSINESATVTMTDSAANIRYAEINTASLITLRAANVYLGLGAKLSLGGSVACSIYLSGYVDGALGIGLNPQL